MIKNSPAKINLFLHIVGKRENGYHNLESIFVKLHNIFDQIEITESANIECHMSNMLQEENLAYKVAIALKQKFSVSEGAKIVIKKNIPLGAGLGGGSSNAGIVLQMLRQLWDLPIEDHDLAKFGSNFGADIPFFVHNYDTAIVEGIGEIINPCRINKKLFLLLVNPGIHVNTNAVFKKGFGNFKPNLSFESNDLWSLIENSDNDLTSNAIILHPEIEGLISLIKSMPGCSISRMSGSGSTCFGVFSNENDLKHAAKHFAKTCWVHYEEINI